MLVLYPIEKFQDDRRKGDLLIHPYFLKITILNV